MLTCMNEEEQDYGKELAFMRAAVELARTGVDSNEGGPFGAIIVNDGQIVGQGYNQVLSTKDPTAHAEIVAIRAAADRLGSFHLTNCVLYTTCEPCPMCLAASYWARVETIIYALTRADAAAMGFSDAWIYDEVSRPLDRRSLEMRHCGREQALCLMEIWREKTDRTAY